MKTATKDDLREMIKNKELSLRDYHDELRHLADVADDREDEIKKQIAALNKIAESISQLKAKDDITNTLAPIIQALIGIQKSQETTMKEIIKKMNRPLSWKMTVASRDADGFMKSITFEAVK